MLYRVALDEPDLSRVPRLVRPPIEWCLAKVPDARPTLAELLAELQALGADLSALAPGWVPEPFTDTPSRHAPTAEPAEVASAAPRLSAPEPARQSAREASMPTGSYQAVSGPAYTGLPLGARPGLGIGALVAGALAAGARAAEALATAGSALGRGASGDPGPWAEQPGDPVSRAVRASVRPGLLAFNPPTKMVQGRKERVEVGIARSPELREALATGLRGRGEAQFAPIPTAAHMGVQLKGPSFEITAFSTLEQLVAPTARWEFDVRPYRAGLQTLTLCVSLRIGPGHPAKEVGGRIAIPILEHEIRIQVNIGYGIRRFITSNWQWLIATVLGLGGALAAWIALVH
jgi:hypothetical protein